MPSEWHSNMAEAPLDRAVLVRHRDGAGEVYDVAINAGKQPDGSIRFVMADVRLDSRQLTHWCELPPQPESI